MYLRFVDEDGTEGVITPDLTVEYDRNLEPCVEAFVADGSNGEGPAVQLQDVILGLPETCELREIEVIEEPVR